MNPLPSGSHNAQLFTATAIRPVFSAEAFRYSNDFAEETPLFVTTGSLTQDGRLPARWSGSLTVTLPEGSPLPLTGKHILTPFGTFIRVFLGVEFNDSISVVPYGTYSLVASSVAISSADRAINMTLSDMSERIAAHRFERPYFTNEGRDLARLCRDLIVDRSPSLAWTVKGIGELGTGMRKKRTWGLEDSTDPWSELVEVLKAHNHTCYFNRNGMFTLRRLRPVRPAPVPIPNASIALDFSSRPPNVVVARSSAEDVHAVGMWQNLDASSPTYVNSSYGKVTEFYASKQIRNRGEARSAAESIGADLQDVAASWGVTIGYGPTIDPQDVLEFTIDDEPRNVVVDSVTVNLPGTTDMVCRSVPVGYSPNAP
jgi:hypothetical protein